MKSTFKKTSVALAVAALFTSPMVFAGNNGPSEGGGGNGGEGNHHSQHDPVKIEKDISLEQDVKIKGLVLFGGINQLNASSTAVVDDKQLNGGNNVQNNEGTNSASVSGNALNNASGNIGLNVTAGYNNQQANAAAFSAADASFVFGAADAEVFASQMVSGNNTTYLGNTNSASLSGNALANASGNIGVNISAGNNNQQKNDLAASVAVARLATATVQVSQVNGGNTNTNNPIHQEEVQQVAVNLALNASGGYLGGGLGGYSGHTGGTYSGTESGTTSGNSYQSSNFYADMWQEELHPGGNNIGHADFDTDSQGAVQNPNKPGVGGLGFDNKGTYSGRESGSYKGSEGGVLGFYEAGVQSLSGTVTGYIPVVVATNLATTNTSSLGDNALMNASGNIGVNIASGTNNQQYNGLAISATQAGTGSGGGGTGGGESLR